MLCVFVQCGFMFRRVQLEELQRKSEQQLKDQVRCLFDQYGCGCGCGCDFRQVQMEKLQHTQFECTCMDVCHDW